MRNTHAMMDGIRKFVLSGALPAIKNVRFHADDAAFTDGSTIHLPIPNALGSDEDHTLWLYKAEHELGHEDPVNSTPHWKAVMDSNKSRIDSTVKQVWNLLSDHVQERNRVGQYAGRDAVLREGRALFINRQLADEGEFPASVFGALFQWDNAARTAWNPLLTSRFDNPANDEVIAKATALVDIAALRNEDDCLEAAIKLRSLFPEEPSKAEEEVVAVLAVSHHGGESEDGDPSDTPSKGGYGGPEFYQARPPKWFKLDEMEGHSRYAEMISDTLGRNNLPAKLKAWLVGKRAVREATGYRSGRLDCARLGDVLRNRDDVFRRREETRAVNAAVFLLVDGSGSMAGTRYATAAAAAMMMCDALSAAKASVRVEAFTEIYDGDEGNSALTHGLWKDWDERTAMPRMIKRASPQGRKLANNSDGESIMWAYHCLRQRKADKKLLIVLSDGSPAGHGPASGGDVHAFTQHAIKLVEADRSVKLVGVGIDGEDCRMYSRRTMVNSSDGTLERTLLDIARSVYE